MCADKTQSVDGNRTFCSSLGSATAWASASPEKWDKCLIMQLSHWSVGSVDCNGDDYNYDLLAVIQIGLYTAAKLEQISIRERECKKKKEVLKIEFFEFYC